MYLVIYFSSKCNTNKMGHGNPKNFVLEKDQAGDRPRYNGPSAKNQAGQWNQRLKNTPPRTYENQ